MFFFFLFFVLVVFFCNFGVLGGGYGGIRFWKEVGIERSVKEVGIERSVKEVEESWVLFPLETRR